MHEVLCLVIVDVNVNVTKCVSQNVKNTISVAYQIVFSQAPSATKPVFSPDLALYPAVGAHVAPQDPLVG